MQPELSKYLFDILVSIESIEDYLGTHRDFNLYSSNKQLRRAVEREIEIIGEAMNSILIRFPNINIENSRKIVDTRNFVIHGYDKVDDVIIWGIVNNHLPKLKNEVKVLLDS